MRGESCVNIIIVIASDYVGDPYGCAKFGANPSRGLLGKWVKYNEIFIYLFIIVKKLNSLKHLLRTIVAESHN